MSVACMHVCLHPYCCKRRVYGVRAEGNVDPATDIQGELTSQNVLFKAETVGAASRALKVGAMPESRH